MNNLRGKLLVAFMIVEFILVTITFSPVIKVTGLESRTIRIVDSKTGSPSISLGSETEPMPSGGYPFTVNVTLEGLTEDLFNYQIAVSFNNTKVRCTAAWIPKDDPSFVFYGHDIMQGPPNITEANLYGCIGLGASLISESLTVSQGVFCQINFTAVKTGTASLDIVPSEAKGYIFDTYLWDYPDMMYILFTSAGFSFTVSASPSLPVASFKFSPSNPKVNQTVTFDASASYDVDGSIASYVWDFGDDTNETAHPPNATVTHAFTHFGIYPVNLTVFDNDGFNTSIVKDVPVGRAPCVNFTYDWEKKDEYPLAPYRNITVTFNASLSYDPDGSIASYVWDFGDGTNETKYPPNATTTNIFAKNGIYNVTLKVVDNDGLHNSTVQKIVVGIRPNANPFVSSPANPNPNEIVTFDASSSNDTDGIIVLLIWDFGDYSELFEVNATDPNIPADEVFKAYHNYTAGGVYQVTLKIYDNDGLPSSIVQNVNVTLTGRRSSFGLDPTQLIGGAIIIVLIVAVAIWYRRRPEKEPSRRDRYRVI